MSLWRIIFPYIKNSVLDLNLFCSRSVLVLDIKNFSCSCSVLVPEQEHVREHVPEQYACSFIPVMEELTLLTENYQKLKSELLTAKYEKSQIAQENFFDVS